MERATTRTNRLVWASLGCLLALLIVAGTACRKEKGSAPEPSGPEPNATSQVQTPAPGEGPVDAAAPGPVEPVAVAATVNGEAITEEELNQRIDYTLNSDPRARNLSPALLPQVRAQLRTNMLDLLISQLLLNQQVRAAGVVVSDEEVATEIERWCAAQNPPITVEQFKQTVESQGGGFDRVREQFREGMALEKFMEAKLAGRTDVNDTEARAFYQERVADFNQPEMVRVSHILLGHSDGADPNSDPNKARAQDLLEQIRQGADFAELAKAHSTDPASAPRGGDLDFFPRGEMVPPFEHVAFALEPNEVSDVVETQYGYHIIKATGHKDARTVPFDEIEANLIAHLKREKQRQLAGEYLKSLRDEATIVYPQGSAPPTPIRPPMSVTPVPPVNVPPTEPNTN
ncbi:MAG: peptidylprolyl isomerase [Sedimentisphaerales bacterium]|nr:peptidylprolyl isomerase [Sedimentisphaerales bacterium]